MLDLENKKLPKIALGAWAWGSGVAGGDTVFGHNYTVENLQPVFQKAVDHNLTLWDTAAVYGMGSSESILGEIIQKYSREDVILSTKFTPQIAEEVANPMEQMLEGSLNRLNTDYIDVYWIHNPADVEKWTPELSPLVKSGKIKQIGVSNHNLAEIKRANEILRKEGLNIGAVQNHFSLLHRDSELSGILNYCQQENITFYAYMVLEQGALTGKYTEEHPFAEGSERADAYNAILPQLTPLVKALQRLGEKYQATAAQVTIAWAIAKGTTPIIGVTKVEQVEDANVASKILLTSEEVEKLEEFASRVKVDVLRAWEAPMV